MVRTLGHFNHVHLFTAATPEYADNILDQSQFALPKERRFYRDSCVDKRGYGKDLRAVVPLQQLGQSLLIDDRVRNRQPVQNLYYIPSYDPASAVDIELLKAFAVVMTLNMFGIDKRKWFKSFVAETQPAKEP